MYLENLARDFAQQQDIRLRPNNQGLLGRKDRYTVGHWDNGKRENTFVFKRFPPFPGKYESTVVIYKEGKEEILKVKVLYGCLEDYITQLDKVSKTNKFCGFVHDVFCQHHLATGSNPQPLDKHMQDTIPVDITEQYLDIRLLLDTLYPKLG